MSKKKLLTEAQVRRFMGLAGLNPLKENAYYQEEMKEEATVPFSLSFSTLPFPPSS